MKKVRGLILAAGRGTRMGYATAEKPKCLTVLAGKTLLDWQKQSLKEAGVEDIQIIKGYRANMINSDGREFLNPVWKETNMVYSLFCATSFRGDSILSYSDITYHPDHVKKLLSSDGDICITADIDWKDLWSLRLENPLDDAETFKSKNGVLREIGKKTNNYDDVEAQYMGLIKLSEKGWNIMHEIFKSFSQERQKNMDMTSMLNILIEKNIRIDVVFVNGKWCEADTLSDIEAYERQLNNENWKHDWR
ncbi:phosphocholine cytidylyltransferase family protein [Psychroflexus sp. CAK57W]|uniref:phosphocholine cytidylyltransferase family protein n=1 Tax=Psychroflexus curvus TaxID=2873595 RepID=UPI001CC91F76|nr:phosphocholine cytidylyltransferase family protein [Psychroflexus curvus]MBZ9786730.1 phosphocholine cytidylyltransferase family protein [Psychroflexus curvus]